jgi:hypothetical protein
MERCQGGSPLAVCQAFKEGDQPDVPQQLWLHSMSGSMRLKNHLLYWSMQIRLFDTRRAA